ncbi:MAG: hypothetical protein HY288_12435 [Planctomycetia bacterium]|nr:hypothetical protein [Planctomycetia bacterium]
MRFKQAFRTRHFVGHRVAMLFIVMLYPAKAFSENSAVIAKNLHSAVADKVEGAFLPRKPKNGTFLQVYGDFSLRVPEQDSILLDEISLILSKEIDGKPVTQEFTPRGVGIRGNKNTWRYVLAEELATKAMGLNHESGEIRLTKEKREAPVVLVVKKNPSRLALLFDIPKESEVKYTLKIGDTIFAVPLPPSKQH